MRVRHARRCWPRVQKASREWRTVPVPKRSWHHKRCRRFKVWECGREWFGYDRASGVNVMYCNIDIEKKHQPKNGEYIYIYTHFTVLYRAILTTKSFLTLHQAAAITSMILLVGAVALYVNSPCHNPLAFFHKSSNVELAPRLVIIWYPFWGTNISPQNGILSRWFSELPKVGYVSVPWRITLRMFPPTPIE